MSNNRILVIGAINIDINAKPNKPYTMHDSNVVKTTMNVGGVGGNIAQNLARLGADVSMITILSDDPLNTIVTNQLDALDIDYSYSVTILNKPTNLYISALDETGELFVGLNDMRLIKSLTPDILEPLDHYINSFQWIVIDNNLPVETILYIGKKYQSKFLIMDAVSCEKAFKLIPVIDYVNVIKMNILEYKTLLKESPDFKKKALNNVEAGQLDLLLSNHEQTITLHTTPKEITKEPLACNEVISTSGAGDALLSGYVYGLLKQKTKEEALDIGLDLAYKTLQVPTSTVKEVNADDTVS